MLGKGEVKRWEFYRIEIRAKNCEFCRSWQMKSLRSYQEITQYIHGFISLVGTLWSSIPSCLFLFFVTTTISRRDHSGASHIATDNITGSSPSLKWVFCGSFHFCFALDRPETPLWSGSQRTRHRFLGPWFESHVGQDIQPFILPFGNLGKPGEGKLCQSRTSRWSVSRGNGCLPATGSNGQRIGDEHTYTECTATMVTYEPQIRSHLTQRKREWQTNNQ